MCQKKTNVWQECGIDLWEVNVLIGVLTLDVAKSIHYLKLARVNTNGGWGRLIERDS